MGEVQHVPARHDIARGEVLVDHAGQGPEIERVHLDDVSWRCCLIALRRNGPAVIPESCDGPGWIGLPCNIHQKVKPRVCWQIPRYITVQCPGAPAKVTAAVRRRAHYAPIVAAALDLVGPRQFACAWLTVREGMATAYPPTTSL